MSQEPNVGGLVNINGNAATATKFKNPRQINGCTFDGTADIRIVDLAGAIGSDNLPLPTQTAIHELFGSVDTRIDDTDATVGTLQTDLATQKATTDELSKGLEEVKKAQNEFTNVPQLGLGQRYYHLKQPHNDQHCWNINSTGRPIQVHVTAAVVNSVMWVCGYVYDIANNKDNAVVQTCLPFMEAPGSLGSISFIVPTDAWWSATAYSMTAGADVNVSRDVYSLQSKDFPVEYKVYKTPANVTPSQTFLLNADGSEDVHIQPGWVEGSL